MDKVMIENNCNGRLSLAETNDALINAMEYMPMAVGLFYRDGRPIYMNRKFRDLHGFHDSFDSVTSFADLLNSGFFGGWVIDPKEYFARVSANLRERGEHRAQLDVGGRILDIHDVLVENNLIISTQKDMTERILGERQIAYLASHDMMTGLANRLSFEAQLKQAITRSAENGGRFSVLMVDLDHFKPVNDTYGHAAGDAVLKEIACRFRARLGHNDFVARLGGDEFVFLCRDGEAGTQALASRLVTVSKKPIVFDGLRLSVGISVGYAIFPDDGMSSEDLLRAADTALYQAKGVGRGTVLPTAGQDHLTAF